MNVLVVDDDPIVVASCRRVLERERFLVTVASNADDALRILEAGRFDLMLADIKMPGKDGLFLLERARIRWPDIRVLVISGYPTPETVSLSRTAGANAFLPKPFTPDELMEAIRGVTKGGSR